MHTEQLQIQLMEISLPSIFSGVRGLWGWGGAEVHRLHEKQSDKPQSKSSQSPEAQQRAVKHRRRSESLPATVVLKISCLSSNPLFTPAHVQYRPSDVLTVFGLVHNWRPPAAAAPLGKESFFSCMKNLFPKRQMLMIEIKN